MELTKAKTLLNKKIKFGLANGFSFCGVVVKVDDQEIVLVDNRADKVHIKLNDISSWFEVRF